jgi:hypothetical protein
VKYKVIKHEPNHRLAMKGQIGPIIFKDGYLLKKKNHGTEIIFWLDVFPTRWAKLFSPLMGLIGKVHAWETLRNLRRELSKQEIASPSGSQ